MKGSYIAIGAGLIVLWYFSRSCCKYIPTPAIDRPFRTTPPEEQQRPGPRPTPRPNAPSPRGPTPGPASKPGFWDMLGMDFSNWWKGVQGRASDLFKPKPFDPTTNDPFAGLE